MASHSATTYEQAALRRALEAALAKLPEEFRVAVVLSDVAGLTPTEMPPRCSTSPWAP